MDFETFLRGIIEQQTRKHGRSACAPFALGVIDGIVLDDNIDDTEKVERIRTTIRLEQEYVLKHEEIPWDTRVRNPDPAA